MTAVFKHELKSYFHSLTAYLYCGFVLLFVGIGAMLYNIQSAVANFEYVLEFVCIGLVVIVPVLTMKVFSEEKKQKTDQLLFSLPLKTSQIVLGKFFALFLIYLIPVAIVAIYPLIFSQYGDVYLPTSYGSIVAFCFLGAALISVGTFISSLTDNQGFAAGISIPVLLFNYYSVTLADYVSSTTTGTVIGIIAIIICLMFVIKHLTKNKVLAYSIGGAGALSVLFLAYFKAEVLEDLLPNIMSSLSLFERFYNFTEGVFDITALVFYVTVVIFFLFLTVQSLEKRRYN